MRKPKPKPKLVLLDFDGPVCAVFSGHPDHLVAHRLAASLEQRGVRLPASFAGNRDPLRVLRWVGRSHPGLVGELDDVLAREETLAVASANETPGARLCLEEFSSLGVPVAVVSNNSVRAIQSFLGSRGLDRYVAAVVGRCRGHPERLKPAADPLVDAIRQLDGSAESCVLVGDSVTDVQAARAAGVMAIGYAKSARHHTELSAAGADLIVTDMRELAAWVRSCQ